MSSDVGGAFESTLRRVATASSAMRTGDPEPVISCWAESPQASIFAPLVPVAKGYGAVVDALHWVGTRFTGGRSEVEYLAAASSGDLGYTVGFERGPASIGGGPERELALRVTHIYLRVEGEWKLLHRHADLLPEDVRNKPEPGR